MILQTHVTLATLRAHVQFTPTVGRHVALQVGRDLEALAALGADVGLRITVEPHVAGQVGFERDGSAALGADEGTFCIVNWSSKVAFQENVLRHQEYGRYCVWIREWNSSVVLEKNFRPIWARKPADLLVARPPFWVGPECSQIERLAVSRPQASPSILEVQGGILCLDTQVMCICLGVALCRRSLGVTHLWVVALWLHRVQPVFNFCPDRQLVHLLFHLV